MQVNVDQKFWKKINPLSKLLMIIGWFCIDAAMQLSGMEQKKEK